MGRVVHLGSTKMIARGHKIPSYIIHDDGSIFDFHEVADLDESGGFELERLADDECMIAPGVIYKKRDQN